jgi:hypothetical protein
MPELPIFACVCLNHYYLLYSPAYEKYVFIVLESCVINVAVGKVAVSLQKFNIGTKSKSSISCVDGSVGLPYTSGCYEGKHISWHFQFFTEQPEVYGNPTEPSTQLIDDFDLVPILNFCKETATFPTATFITQDSRTINTYFSYAGEYNK